MKGAGVPRAAFVLAVALAAAGPVRAQWPTQTKGQLIAWDLLEQGVLSTAKVTPYGGVVTVIYKLSDITRQMGVAATERENQTLDAELVLVGRYAAELKALQASGADLSTDPRAQAAKAQLRMLAHDMGDGGRSRTGYLLMITTKHFEYAVGRVALSEAVSLAAGKLAGRLLKAIPAPAGASKWIARRVDGRRWSSLKLFGWSTLKSRQLAVQQAVPHYIEEGAGRLASAAADAVPLGAPETPAYAMPQQLAQPIEIRPYIPPMVARPIVVPQAAVLNPTRPPLPTAIAPAYGGGTAYYSAPRGSETSIGPAPPTPTPAPAQPELRYRHEFECAGAGNKPGCGAKSFDGDNKDLHH